MDHKNAYAQKLEARRDQWRAEIDDLRGQQEPAQKKFDELRDAQGEAWEDLKSGIESARGNLGKFIRSAVDQYS